MIDYIKLEECVDGGLYKLDARNLRYGVFNAAKKCFVGIRYKLGDEFLDIEEHWDVGGTARSVEYLGETQYRNPDILDRQLFLYLKSLKSDNPVDYYEELLLKYGYILDVVEEAEENAKKFVKENKRSVNSKNGMVKMSYIPASESVVLKTKNLMEGAKKDDALLSVVSEYIY